MDDAEQQVHELLDRFMDALNAYDPAGMDACLHFPHVRIADRQVVVYEQAGNNPMDLFDRLKAADGWHRSEWVHRRPSLRNDHKLHMEVRYTRLREDGSVIGIYDSLYIATKLDGSWGIQARSSFGP